MRHSLNVYPDANTHTWVNAFPKDKAGGEPFVTLRLYDANHGEITLFLFDRPTIDRIAGALREADRKLTEILPLDDAVVPIGTEEAALPATDVLDEAGALAEAKKRAEAKGYPFRQCHGVHPPYSGKCGHCRPPSEQDVADDEGQTMSAFDPKDLPPEADVPAPSLCQQCRAEVEPGRLFCRPCTAEIPF